MNLTGERKDINVIELIIITLILVIISAVMNFKLIKKDNRKDKNGY
jgi:hypothetical protein